MTGLSAGNLVMAPWCGVLQCEEEIKKRSAEQEANEDRTQLNENGEKVEKLSGAAKSLCIPFNQPEMPQGQCCVQCGQAAKQFCMFGRSY
jgi:prolyl-tRNA synthetase